MSEQFGLHQSRINAEQSTGATLSHVAIPEVYGSCYQFFSCSGISKDQNRRSAPADLSDQVVEKVIGAD